MLIECPKCHEETEDNYGICKHCGYVFAGKKSVSVKGQKRNREKADMKKETDYLFLGLMFVAAVTLILMIFALVSLSQNPVQPVIADSTSESQTEPTEDNAWHNELTEENKKNILYLRDCDGLKLLSDLGFKAKTHIVQSKEYADHSIFDVYQKEDVVYIKVAIGGGKEDSTEEVEVPYLVNKSVDDAVELLKEKGLYLRKEKSPVPNAKVEAGSICKQDPEMKTTVKKGTTITVTISKGDQVKVPDLLGKSNTEVQTTLEALGLKAELTGNEKKTVIGQDPKAGETIKMGETVTVHFEEKKISSSSTSSKPSSSSASSTLSSENSSSQGSKPSHSSSGSDSIDSSSDSCNHDWQKKFDEKGHWEECGKCHEKKTEEEHKWDDNGKCEKCQYQCSHEYGADRRCKVCGALKPDMPLSDSDDYPEPANPSNNGSEEK